MSRIYAYCGHWPQDQLCINYAVESAAREPYLFGFLAIEFAVIACILVIRFIVKRKARNALD